MKKSIENRGVLMKFVLVAMFLAISIATTLVFVGCSKVNYDTNSCTIEFDKKVAKFTLPKDVALRVEKQTQYFVFEQVEPKSKKNIGDLIQYVYDNSASSKNTFRINKSGCLTKAGYFEEEGRFEIKLDDNENVYSREEYSKNNLPSGLSGVEDLILTNIGNNYFKQLNIGEQFDLNLYRNNMIINNATSNVQIEPEFEIELLKGDSVRFDRKRENKFDVVAIKEGITHIKIKYQAIDVLNNGKLFRYNASNQSREVVATFAVGENYTEDVDIKVEDRAFDSEFDTIYFQGQNGSVKSEILGASSVKAVQLEQSSGLSKDNSVSKIDTNIYELKIENGYNIFEIIKENKKQYVTIYGARISVNVQNENGVISADNKAKIGDKIKIKVDGIYNILPKMSGIYNPTQQYSNGSTPSNGCKLQIFMKNEPIADAKYVSQYYYKENSEIEFELKAEHLFEDKFVFNLQFYIEWWGEDLGAHRNITDDGVQTNVNAQRHNCYMGYFEQIVIG